MMGWILKTKGAIFCYGFVTLMLGMVSIISSLRLYHDSPFFQRELGVHWNTTATVAMAVLANNFTNSIDIPHLILSTELSTNNYSERSIITSAPTNLNSVDLAYIDVRDASQHPHRGAVSPRDPHQVGVYVPDVTHLRRHPPPLSWTSEMLQRECQVRDKEHKALQRIRLSKGYDTTNHNNRTTRLLCIIYSLEKNRNRYQAIRETWGPRCDGFFVASDLTIPEWDAVHIVHAGPEAYDNMYQKVRSMWSFVYDHFYHDFDYFHIGGDDMFVMVDNLRAYVDSDEIKRAAAENGNKQVPLFLGGSISYAGDMTRVYQTGGPGYTLNKAALKKLVVEGLPTCGDNKRVSWEDIVISRLFREMNISVYRTTDQDNGVRYNHYSPATHYFGEEPEFYPNWTKPLNYNRGKNYSSVHSISFHYITPRNMRRFFALLYGLCNS